MSTPEHDASEEEPLRRLRLRYDGRCSNCDIPVFRGTEAFWNAANKTVLCLACGPTAALNVRDVAGASAAAEGERRKAKRVAAVRNRYGDHAAAVAAQLTETDIEASWAKGSQGESRLATYLEREVGDAAIALHDRLIPGTRANIDHMYVTANGVWVVDAKAYAGKLARREVGPLWRRDNEVMIAGRNRTNLARGVERQVAAVIAALRPDPEMTGTDVHAALCFLDSEWNLVQFPFQIGNVWVMYPGALKRRLKKRGSLSRDTMERIARRLDLSLPPAAQAAT